MKMTTPDIGVEKAVVSEILVKVGDVIAENDGIVLLESDKASVEVPSSMAGEVVEITVKQGDVVKEGVVLMTIKPASIEQPTPTTTAISTTLEVAPAQVEIVASTKAGALPAQSQPMTHILPTTIDHVHQLTTEQQAANASVYAGPAVRQLARELGVILTEVQATGMNGRIVKDDVFAYVKSRLNQPTATALATVAGLPALPDFSAFGGGEIQTLTRLQQVSIPQLSLNNLIPQVTQFDLADITELEAWRNELKTDFKKQGVSLTILAFMVKVTAYLLKEERYFAAHLMDDQKSVLLRHEIHIGIAVATEDGLIVPVLRHPEQKSIRQIAQELAELSQKARDKKLNPKDLQGANFTLTSLGSIGGTAFTPLVNFPQVAILGISPATMQPVWNGQDFEPRLLLPLSLSYDHRVINGVDAARFTHKLTLLLKDIRKILL
ncbi:MAG: biotin/lipoyl-binding protein [Acinetobacter sp.]|jgi:pyruvate dehydrogenase E2 component (dihydrolipoamide acetyltransferase)|nr:MAG: biotin/lipoyl-binding protein [Acinetobacter sp.]